MVTAYNSSFDTTRPFSDTGSTIALADSTELMATIPGDASTRYRIQFSWAYNANVWVNYNSTAVVPSAGTINSSRAEFRPGEDGSARYVRGGDVLHFISSGIAFGGYTLLQLPSQ
jgi:hypothetical protein